MSVHVLEAMAREGFEEVLALHDRRSGLRAFLALHDTSPGRAFGGIRRKSYRDEKDALLDCLRLARAMSFKCVLADVAGGGAKLVMLERGGIDWKAAYDFVGERIERLGGRYFAGPDAGTGSQELAWVASRTRFVVPLGEQGAGDLAAATASGVFAGMRAALRHLDGETDWGRRRVVVQGLGSVGEALVQRLVQLGARVWASDLDPERALEVTSRHCIEALEPGSEFDFACDIFAPCAMGGILHDLSVQRLASRVVCGAANNQLARYQHGERLHERGIVYVPDFAVNSGGLVAGSTFHLEGRAPALSVIEGRIGGIAADLLERSRAESQSPSRIAHRIALQKLAERHLRRDRVPAPHPQPS
jgi:glutamate dehydrogenase/leucine dehydrogenase